MTTQTEFNNHIQSIESNPEVVEVTQSESIHRDEFDYHAIAVMCNGDKFIVGYTDPARGHDAIYSTIPLGKCPVVIGKGLWESKADYYRTLAS